MERTKEKEIVARPLESNSKYQSQLMGIWLLFDPSNLRLNPYPIQFDVRSDSDNTCNLSFIS
ncbi:hypothetical protein CRG98_029529 [Punica granatum]|uniref:Uncharacterized protein n=1 Tax=Punica granatum TaxID=22663 RepID=A0A2I0J1I9_PUNGR|nr:hypothetical protein CRG98_029529 [Punica granatum]